MTVSGTAIVVGLLWWNRVGERGKERKSGRGTVGGSKIKLVRQAI